MKNLKITTLFFLLFACVASNKSYAQTTVNLPTACNCDDPDTDGDGTPNSIDDDDDGDGVLDVNDICPLFYGTGGADGCPATSSGGTSDPDSDGDGVPDLYDDCPGTTAAEAADPLFVPATGCVQPDTDGDGVADDVDDCPLVAGTEANGCPPGTIVPNGGDCGAAIATKVVEITSPSGKIWMDRNLGASRAATSDGDFEAYGCSYQWGRDADGHELVSWANSTNGSRVNAVIIAPSPTRDPGHSDFINRSPDWMEFEDPNLSTVWNGVDGVNNPCPPGWRVPTSQEWGDEIGAHDNSEPALATFLQVARAGQSQQTGEHNTGDIGRAAFWSSTPISTSTTREANRVELNKNQQVTTQGLQRHYAMSIRCIKGD